MEYEEFRRRMVQIQKRLREVRELLAIEEYPRPVPPEDPPQGSPGRQRLRKVEELAAAVTKEKARA